MTSLSFFSLLLIECNVLALSRILTFLDNLLANNALTVFSYLYDCVVFFYNVCKAYYFNLPYIRLGTLNVQAANKEGSDFLTTVFNKLQPKYSFIGVHLKKLNDPYFLENTLSI